MSWKSRSEHLEKDRISPYGTARVCEGSISANGFAARCFPAAGPVGRDGEAVPGAAGGTRTAGPAAARQERGHPRHRIRTRLVSGGLPEAGVPGTLWRRLRNRNQRLHPDMERATHSALRDRGQYWELPVGSEGAVRLHPPLACDRAHTKVLVAVGGGRALPSAEAGRRVDAAHPKHGRPVRELQPLIPPMVITGIGERIPDWETAPLTTGVDVAPNPLA